MSGSGTRLLCVVLLRENLASADLSRLRGAQPTIHQILLRSPHPSPLPNIRFIRSCSSALSATTHGELEKAFKAPVLEAYAVCNLSGDVAGDWLTSGSADDGGGASDDFEPSPSRQGRSKLPQPAFGSQR